MYVIRIISEDVPDHPTVGPYPDRASAVKDLPHVVRSTIAPPGLMDGDDDWCTEEMLANEIAETRGRGWDSWTFELTFTIVRLWSP